MNEKTAILACLWASASVWCVSSAANDFRYEVDVGAARLDAGSVETESFNLSGRFYFTQVDDSKGPLAEAAFLTRANSISVFSSNAETEFGFPPAIPTTLTLPTYATIPIDAPLVGLVLPVSAIVGEPQSDSDAYGARLRYVTDSAWIANAQVSRIETSSSTFGPASDEDGTSIGLAIGKYVRERTTVTVGYEYTDLERENLFPSFSCNPPNPCDVNLVAVSETDTDQHAWSLRARHLQDHGGRHYALRGEIAYEVRSDSVRPLPLSGPMPISLIGFDTDLDTWRAGTGLTFYPARDWGVGLDYAHVDTEFGNSNNYALNATWFVTPAIAVSGSVTRISGGNSIFGANDDTDGVSLRLSGRF